MAESGVPSVLGLVLEVNAGVLAAVYAAFGAHQATAWWDVKYAESRREVTPNEQHIHGMLENVPLMAASFLTVLHWDLAKALLRLGDERRRFRPELKRQPLPQPQAVAIVLGTAGLVGAAYAEELWRCARVDSSLEKRPELKRDTTSP